MEFDIVIGLHSIAELLRAKRRRVLHIFASEEALDELKKREGISKNELPADKLVLKATHDVQEEAKKWYKKADYEYQRVPSNMFVIAEAVPPRDLNWLYDEMIKRDSFKLLVLDQVTDAHNGAAIMRTAAFYGVDAIMLSSKGSFGIGPGFNRIASGAVEYIEVVKVSALPKTLTKLADMGIQIIGFSEHAKETLNTIEVKNKTCLVLGAEDFGLSNAVERLLTTIVALKPQGKIKSLNVSVAAAVAMEKIFGQN